MTLTLFHYLGLSAIVFILGILGLLKNRQNLIGILMSIELILLAVSMNFVAFSSFSGDIQGQIFALFIVTVAAAEAAIGLAILVLYFRHRKNITLTENMTLKG